MVWNHPKETSICISYGRMFQLCTSLLTPGAVGVRKLGEEQQSEEDGRQSQFGKQAGAFYIAWDLNFHPFRNSLTLWITFGQPPPDPFRAFLLGGGEVWMERGNTERDVNECATVLPMCPFLNIYIYSGFPWLFVFNIHDKPFSKEVQHLKGNDQRRCLVPFGV